MNLCKLIAEDKLPAEIAVVVASRKCKGVELAKQAGLDVHMVEYKKMRAADEYSDAITSLLDKANVDLVVMAGFLSLWPIPPQYLGKVINIHPALLPAFGGHKMFGHHVHEAVLAHGCKVSGCTVHFVTNQYDCGPIIIQRCVPVQEGDTPDTLADRVFEQEVIALPEAIKLIAQRRVSVKGQVVKIS